MTVLQMELAQLEVEALEILTNVPALERGHNLETLTSSKGTLPMPRNDYPPDQWNPATTCGMCGDTCSGYYEESIGQCQVSSSDSDGGCS